MKVTKLQAEANRKRVVEVAARLFREKGYEGTSLEDVMQAAGLTRGGFYFNFKSKQDLAVEACKAALDTHLETWERFLAASSCESFKALVEFYVSEGHCSLPGKGCLLPAFAADAARQGDPIKAVLSKGIGDYIDILGKMLPAGDREARHVLSILAEMTGAVLLARATNERALASEILAAARQSLLKVRQYPASAMETDDERPD